MLIISASCSNTAVAGQTATPNFATAVLPSTSTPISEPTTAYISSTPMANQAAALTVTPVEGITTTLVNVRAEPSTASEMLGMINLFTKIQITGQDASGSWYQLMYAESKNGNGWVRAEYVQVDATAQISIIGAEAGSGSAMSGLVIQKINVRKGPATTFESLGVLSPNDVVFITGKDPSSAWMQIEFANAPEGTGWVASEFLQVSHADSLPTIGEVKQVFETPSATTILTPATFQTALEDGDSMQAPLTAAFFSPTNIRAIQIEGDISAPAGDTKDWVQFSADGGGLVLEVLCASNLLQVELWSNEVRVDTFALPCGDKHILVITPNSNYLLSLSALNLSETQHINYIFNLEISH